LLTEDIGQEPLKIDVFKELNGALLVFGRLLDFLKGMNIRLESHF